MNWYYQNFAVTNRDSTPQLKKIHLDKFPIPELSSSGQSRLVTLVKNVLDLHKKLSGAEENSNKWEKFKSQVSKANQEIDENVYKLYGLTHEEIEIIEEKLRSFDLSN